MMNQSKLIFWATTFWPFLAGIVLIGTVPFSRSTSTIIISLIGGGVSLLHGVRHKRQRVRWLWWGLPPDHFTEDKVIARGREKGWAFQEMWRQGIHTVYSFLEEDRAREEMSNIPTGELLEASMDMFTFANPYTLGVTNRYSYAVSSKVHNKKRLSKLDKIFQEMSYYDGKEFNYDELIEKVKEAFKQKGEAAMLKEAGITSMDV